MGGRIRPDTEAAFAELAQDDKTEVLYIGAVPAAFFQPGADIPAHRIMVLAAAALQQSLRANWHESWRARVLHEVRGEDGVTGVFSHDGRYMIVSGDQDALRRIGDRLDPQFVCGRGTMPIIMQVSRLMQERARIMSPAQPQPAAFAPPRAITLS